MSANRTLDLTELQSVLNEVSRALEDQDAVGIVTSAEPFVYFIARDDSGLRAKVAVTLAQGSNVLGVLPQLELERAFFR